MILRIEKFQYLWDFVCRKTMSTLFDEGFIVSLLRKVSLREHFHRKKFETFFQDT